MIFKPEGNKYVWPRKLPKPVDAEHTCSTAWTSPSLGHKGVMVALEILAIIAYIMCWVQ